MSGYEVELGINPKFSWTSLMNSAFSNSFLLLQTILKFKQSSLNPPIIFLQKIHPSQYHHLCITPHKIFMDSKKYDSKFMSIKYLVSIFELKIFFTFAYNNHISCINKHVICQTFPEFPINWGKQIVRAGTLKPIYFILKTRLLFCRNFWKTKL